jgi:1-phosphofructokinase family hexose kinase
MNGEFFLSICLNPTLQKTIVLQRLLENEVNRSGEYYLDVAGKGVNCSRVLVQLGEKVIHLTQAGGINRELLLSLISKDGISCRWVESNSEIRFCYTILNMEKQTTTEIIEEPARVGTGTEKMIWNNYEELLPKCHTVIIAGTKCAGFSAELYPNMVKLAKEEGKTVILDLQGADLNHSLQYKPDIIKPNLTEFVHTFYRDLSGYDNKEQRELTDCASRKMLEIYEQYGIISILTRGNKGVIYIDQGKIVGIPATVLKPLNTTGCGDAFTAGVASSWYKRRDINIAVNKGMECASQNALLIHPGVIQ